MKTSLIMNGRCSNASSRVRSTMMADARTSRLLTHKRSDTSTPWGTQSRAKPLTECKHGDKNMSLLDIDDFSVRSKVAQLMAVAPALAVIDLYHLIIDSEGDLPRARKQAIRMSEAPKIRYRPGLDDEGDEIMVKIDPNNPAFEWDDDEPYPEFDTATAARPSKPTLKATRSRSIKGSVRATESTKSNTKNRSNVGAKRARSTFMNPTHAREISSDRDFIVPDNVIHYDLDSDVSNDSGHSTNTRVHNKCEDSDILDVDDQLDLDIDMQPRFAYNARMLGITRRGRNV